MKNLWCGTLADIEKEITFPGFSRDRISAPWVGAIVDRDADTQEEETPCWTEY